MKSRIIGNVDGEGFTSVIQEDADGRVFFQADADIDADGANGQNGKPAAYMADNSGSEALANGGMRRNAQGVVSFFAAWGRDIVVTTPDNKPRIYPNGVIVSRTWYVHPGKKLDDPAAYVDSETVAYIVVPPMIVRGVKGVVRGCLARVTWRGKSIWAVVADLGPRNKNGELSIEAARQLGMNCDPRKGGRDIPDVMYEMWPGKPAPGFKLLPS